MTKQQKEDRQDEKLDTSALTNERPALSMFAIDFEEFAHFFEDEDITEDQARAFLKIYWEIACEIMSLGFGFHPAQQAQKACGKQAETPEAPPVIPPDNVYLNQRIISENFEQAAVPKPGRKGVSQ